jgi:hypothetical protein
MRQQRSRPGAYPILWVAAFTLVFGAASAPAPKASTPASSFDWTSLAEPALEQYRAMRRMHALAEKVNHEGWLDALTEFDARGFRYQIVAERGSESVRNKVLKALLKREQELIANGDFGRGELTPDNYEFGEETTRDGLKYVLITPKRKDVMLVDGRMVLSPEGELLRVEGILAKNPSFWTTRVNVIRHYARVDGVRVPIQTESIAQVRFVGASKLNMTYEYETINNRGVKTAALSALAGVPSAHGR